MINGAVGAVLFLVVSSLRNKVVVVVFGSDEKKMECYIEFVKREGMGFNVTVPEYPQATAYPTVRQWSV